MKKSCQAELLRVFIGEKDKYKGKPLFEAIVELARERKMAGATVLRGMLGFGADSHLHTAKILRLSEDLPVVVEIVDETEKIEQILPELGEMVDDGLVTREKVQMAVYRREKG